jgi:hypothetical protein
VSDHQFEGPVLTNAMASEELVSAQTCVDSTQRPVLINDGAGETRRVKHVQVCAELE